MVDRIVLNYAGETYAIRPIVQQTIRGGYLQTEKVASGVGYNFMIQRDKLLDLETKLTEIEELLKNEKVSLTPQRKMTLIEELTTLLSRDISIEGPLRLLPFD